MRKTSEQSPFQKGKHIFYGLILLIMLFLTACGPSTVGGKVTTPSPPPLLPTRTPTQPRIDQVPTPSPSPSPSPTPSPSPSPTATEGPGLSHPFGQAAGAGNWQLIFDDEFNGTALDTSKWSTCYFNYTVGNGCDHGNELQLYQPDDVSVSNGVLTLQAERRDVTGANGKTYHYTSGMVSTGPPPGGTSSRFTYTYGYAEMRAKTPAGAGFWSAFWMMPASLTWPPEIDAFEILGSNPDAVTMHYHFGNASTQVGSTWTGPNTAAGWHIFGIDWEPGSITWYVDGVARYSYTNASTVSSQPMYLIANLAIGDWGGPVNASTPFPNSFQVDYIRIWQK